jgi:DNA-binding SARP family transcriptional activator/WD40 repeat protein
MREPVDSTPGVADVACADGARDVVRVLVLGPLAVEHDGRPLHVAGTHRRRLLAFVASRVGQVVSVDAIVDALWGDDPPATAARTIQSHVARLRGSFAGVNRELIETTAGGYRLALAPDAVDATEFEQLAVQGRRRLGAGDFAGAAGVLDRALALWRGEPYVDFARCADFASAEAVRLNLVRWAATEDLAEARLESGALEPVIADVERLVAEESGRERAWGLLMRALYAAGRQHEALVAFQRARRALVDGFGIDPGPELRAMERRILEQDPALTVRRERAFPAGLRRDSIAFVGRDRERAWLVDAWRAAGAGSGQLRLLLGPADSGRTRLAAELAATVIIDGGHVVHVRGEDGFEPPPGVSAGPGSVVDWVTERSRTGPVLVVVDDAEWCDAATVRTVVGLAGAIEHAAVMLLVIADPSGSGPAIETLIRLDPSEGRTLRLDAMGEEALARLISADGVDGEGVAAVLAIAGGLPGVARREAAAWAERAASDHLTAAAASSIDATAVAAGVRASMFDDVLSLVAARTRRDELMSSTWAGRQPYRALAAYEPHDADLYVGRERLVAELAARVVGRPLVAVIGASGSGKSSLVRAGLVPLVRSGLLPGSGPWRTTVIVPAADSAPALDVIDALDEPGPQLLVVDQFEEVFAAGSAELWAGRILDVVLDTALDVHAVIVVRADQYGALAAIPSLAAFIEDAQVVIGPPTDDELRRIVEVPARRTGCQVEPALIDLVAADVAGHDAALPLVSAALAEVWSHRVGNTLTADGYARLGGLSAAVERMGARALQRAGDEQAVREVMLRLVDVTEDGQWVRRRIPVDDVPGELAGAIDALVDAHLVQRNDTRIDVVHEVVFRAWPQLASWLEEARAELVFERDLRSAARTWDAGGRNDDDLYRGARLLTGDEFVGRHADVSPVIREFIAAGQHVAEREANERERQRSRVNRRLRALLATAVALLLVATVAGVLALRQAERADQEAAAAGSAAARADEEAAAAEAAATRADARRVSDQALATPEFDRALLLAVEGARLDESPETLANLLTVVTREPGLPIATARGDGEVAIQDVSPNGELLVSIEAGRLVLRDADTFAIVRSAAGATGYGSLEFASFAPGDKQLAVWYGTAVVLYDTATLEPAAAQLGGVTWSGYDTVAYSPDGRLIAVSSTADSGVPDVSVWDTSDPDVPVLHIDARELGEGAGVAFSADGDRLYVTTYPPGDTRAFDTATGEQVAASTKTASPALFLAPPAGRPVVSPDGTLVALTGADHQPVLLDGETLAEVRSPSLPPGAEFDPLGFSRDGTKLILQGADGTYSWDLTTGGEPDLIVSSATAAWQVMGHHGDILYTSGGRALNAWDLRSDPSSGAVRRSAIVAKPDIDVEIVVPLPGGRVAYLAGNILGSAPGGSMQILDVASGRLGAVVDLGHDGLTRVGSTADGERVATTGADGTIRVWDTRTGALLTERRLAEAIITGVVYINGDSELLVSELSGDVYVVDAETLEPSGPRVDTGKDLFVPFARPTEPSAVVMTSTGRVLLIDLAAGRVVEDLDPGFTGWWAAPSPDGQRLAVVGRGGEVRLYDVAAGRWTGPPVQANLGDLTFVDYSPDGTTFLTQGADGRLGLRDGVTGELIGTVVPGAADVPINAAYVGDNRTVFAAAADGTSYTWDIDPAHWIEFACTAAGRNLTADEWREAFGDRPYRQTCPQH